jgi:hypothetical protein
MATTHFGCRHACLLLLNHPNNLRLGKAAPSWLSKLYIKVRDHAGAGSRFIQARGVLKKELIAHLRSRRIMRMGKTDSTAGQTSAEIIDVVSIRPRLAEIEDRTLSASNAMTSFVYL